MRYLTLVVLLTGCVKTNVVPLGTHVDRPAVVADSVLVYRTADQVPGKYTELAELTADGGDVVAGNKLIAQLRKKAGALGANAIVLLDSTRPQETVVTGGYGTTPVLAASSGSYRTRAVAIYVER